MRQQEPDQRYRMLVNLVRTDRPNYWWWHCPNCQRKVGEIVNGQVLSVTDFMDMNNLDKIGVGLRCSGRTEFGRRCDFWYYFNVSEKPQIGR